MIDPPSSAVKSLAVLACIPASGDAANWVRRLHAAAPSVIIMLDGTVGEAALLAHCMVIDTVDARPLAVGAQRKRGVPPASAAAGRDLTPHQAMRAAHRQVVLAQLRRGATTQAAIARATGLSQATVSRVLAEFRHADLIETADGRRHGAPRGRVPAVLQLRPGSRFLVGIEFEDSRCVAVVTDLHLHVKQRAVTQPRLDTAEHMVDSAANAFTQATDGLDRQRICAVGVGTPGVVETTTGVLRTLTWPGVRLENVPIGQWLTARLGLPVAVANRSRAAAVGERFGGAGRDSHDLVYVWIGFGIAAGVMLGGTLHQGAAGSAGELGHVVVAPDGPLCACGARGCLQAMVSGPAIARRAGALLRAGECSVLRDLTGGGYEAIDATTICRAAAADDALALRVLDEAGTYLGRAIATLLNLLNPDTIVLGGPVGEVIGPFVLPPIRRQLRSSALAVTVDSARIVLATLGNDAGAIGAAALALEYAPWTLTL
jgi:glucokinase